MKYRLILFVLFIFFSGESIRAQFGKFDSTARSGKISYRVICNNKNVDRNEVIVKLGGFEKEARSAWDFFARGRVTGIYMDDVNNDGFFDLLVTVYSGPNGEFGTMYTFASQENKSLITFLLPDPMMDGKLNTGYKGYDQFSMLDGTVLRKFPIYKAGDEKGSPTGGYRVAQYQAVREEQRGYKFQLLRTYDTK